jgi:hypothetical protein
MRDTQPRYRPNALLRREGCLLSFLGMLFICPLVYVVTLGTAQYTIAQYQAKWKQSAVTSYTVQMQSGTFSWMGNLSAEVVQNGRVIESVGGYHSQPTIDRLFERAKWCAFWPVRLCEVEYDPIYGYPKRFVEQDFDFGYITEIVCFQPNV